MFISNIPIWQDILDEILGHVAKHGWDGSVWSDDNLSSKKLYPKFQFPSKSKAWLPRTKTSTESMMAAVLFLQNRHDRMADKGNQKRKPDVHFVEEVSMKAACAVNLMTEFVDTCPVDRKEVFAQWIQAWLNGDTKVDIELEQLLFDRVDKLDVRVQIPTFKRLSDKQVFHRPVVNLEKVENQLVIDQYHLQMKQIEYDVNVFKTWSKKTMNIEYARDQATWKWRRDRRLQALEAADLALSSCSKLVVFEGRKTERAIQETMTFKKNCIQSKLGLDNSSQITQVIYYNCSAPCLITADNLENGLELMSWRLSDQMQSIGVMLCPAFSHQRGRVFWEEKTILERLVRNHVNIDWPFSILFCEKLDARDQRPMSYQGRLIFASPLELSKNCWFSCDLRKTQRTTEIAQLSPKKMREIEDVDPHAVPHSTDERQRISNASKYSQIGIEACQQVFSSVLKGSSYETVGPAVLLIDLHLGTGEMYQAFLNMRSTQPHTFYLGFCEDQNQASYVEQLSREELADKYMSGTPLPSGEKIDFTVPADLLESLPEIPRLNVLVTWY